MMSHDFKNTHLILKKAYLKTLSKKYLLFKFPENFDKILTFSAKKRMFPTKKRTFNAPKKLTFKKIVVLIKSSHLPQKKNLDRPLWSIKYFWLVLYKSLVK